MENIRFADFEDITAISNVLAASWKTAYRDIVNDDYLDGLKNDHWVSFLNEGLKNSNIFAMVFEEESIIIGAAILSQTENDNEVCLMSFYLLPEKIGKGFGHIFYERIESALKKKGFSKCALEVLEDNERAIRFYEKHGFKYSGKKVKASLGEGEYFCKAYEKVLL